MNKWIYSSVTLNIYALLCIIYFAYYAKTTFKIFLFDGPSVLDFLGFGYFPQCFHASSILILFYIVELIIYKFCKRLAFCFPASKLQKTKWYYFLFFFGIFIGTGFLIALISVIPILLIGPIYNHIMLNSIR